MSQDLTPELAAAMLAAQGVGVDRAAAVAAGEFAARVLRHSQPVFARIAFEDEPSGYTAALRKNAP